MCPKVQVKKPHLVNAKGKIKPDHIQGHFFKGAPLIVRLQRPWSWDY